MADETPNITVDVRANIATLRTELSTAEAMVADSDTRMQRGRDAALAEATRRRMARQQELLAAEQAAHAQYVAGVERLTERSTIAFGRQWKSAFETARANADTIFGATVDRLGMKIAKAGIAFAIIGAVDQGLRGAADAIRSGSPIADAIADSVSKAISSVPVVGALYDVTSAATTRFLDEFGAKDRANAKEAALMKNAPVQQQLAAELDQTVAAARMAAAQASGDPKAVAAEEMAQRQAARRKERVAFESKINAAGITGERAAEMLAKFDAAGAMSDAALRNKDKNEKARELATTVEKFRQTDLDHASSDLAIALATDDGSRARAEFKAEQLRINSERFKYTQEQRDANPVIDQLFDTRIETARANMNKRLNEIGAREDEQARRDRIASMTEQRKAVEGNLQDLRRQKDALGNISAADFITGGNTAIGEFRFGQQDAGAQLAENAKESVRIEGEILRIVEWLAQNANEAKFI